MCESSLYLPAWTSIDYESVAKFRRDLTVHVEIRVIWNVYRDSVGRDRAVGTGTRYGMEGPETESP